MGRGGRPPFDMAAVGDIYICRCHLQIHILQTLSLHFCVDLAHMKRSFSGHKPVYSYQPRILLPSLTGRRLPNCSKQQHSSPVSSFPDHF